MGNTNNCLFLRLRRHRFLLLQNLYTIRPVYKLRAQILMYYVYTVILRTVLPCTHKKILIFRGAHKCGL